MQYPRKSLRRASSIRRDIDRLLEKIRQGSPVALHLGCGTKPIAGMINADLHNEAADRQLDAADLHEFTAASVDLIEHHHLMEHFSFAQVQKAFQEWARVLKPGGFLVMTCPDLNQVIRKWRRANTDEQREKTLQMIYGSQEHEGMFHKSGYDLRRVTQLLTQHGFALKYHYAPYPSRSTPSLLVVARRN